MVNNIILIIIITYKDNEVIFNIKGRETRFPYPLIFFHALLNKPSLCSLKLPGLRKRLVQTFHLQVNFCLTRIQVPENQYLLDMQALHSTTFSS